MGCLFYSKRIGGNLLICSGFGSKGPDAKEAFLGRTFFNLISLQIQVIILELYFLYFVIISAFVVHFLTETYCYISSNLQN